MAHHTGVTSTYGITLPAGAEAQEASKNRSIEISKPPAANGEYKHPMPLRQMKVEVSLSGYGPASLDAVTVGNVSPPSTMKVLEVEQGEKSSGDGRATFRVQGTGMEAFDEETENTPADAGEGSPDENTLGIVGVTLALSETLSVKSSVKDVNAPATDGTPGARATVGKENSVSVRGKGDIPASLGLGVAGLATAALSTGKLIVRQLAEDQKAQEINGWGAEASHFPSAA